MLFLFMDMVDDKELPLFVQIYDKYKNLCYKIAYDIVKNASVSEEILQDTFLQVAKNIKKLSLKNEIDCNKTRNYVVIISKRLAINYYNRYIKYYTSDMSDEPELPAKDVVNVTNSIADEINRLDSLSADIIKLRYAYGYTTREVAKIVGMNENAVRQRIFRAKESLQKNLTEKGWIK